MRPQDRRPDPEALPTDERVIYLVGTAVWLVLGLLALALRAHLDASGHGWWLPACLAGLVLGLGGLWHEHRRTTRRR